MASRSAYLVHHHALLTFFYLALRHRDTHLGNGRIHTNLLILIGLLPEDQKHVIVSGICLRVSYIIILTSPLVSLDIHRAASSIFCLDQDQMQGGIYLASSYCGTFQSA